MLKILIRVGKKLFNSNTIMENQTVVKKGWVKASMVFAIIALVFALLPLVSAWFMFFTVFNFFIAPLSIIFGVIAILKKQNLTKSIIAMAIAVVALFTPRILVEQYAKSAEESAENLFSAAGSLMDAVDYDSDLDYDYEY